MLIKTEPINEEWSTKGNFFWVLESKMKAEGQYQRTKITLCLEDSYRYCHISDKAEAPVLGSWGIGVPQWNTGDTGVQCSRRPHWEETICVINHSSTFNIHLHIHIWRDRFRVVKLGRILPSKVKPLKTRWFLFVWKPKNQTEKVTWSYSSKQQSNCSQKSISQSNHTAW